MALCASGAMSLGGATTGRSVNLELGCSATAAICMNRTDVRTLACKASGAIAMSDFYGKSSAPPPPTSLGTYYSDYGGYYTGTQGGYYLFASTIITGAYCWKTTKSSTTTSTTDGYSNTYNNKNATHPLFNYVGGLTTNGFSDWYVASCAEAWQLAVNRNAVGGWTLGCCYWTSTQHQAGYAYYLEMFTNSCALNNGYPAFTVDITALRTRPIRRC